MQACTSLQTDNHTSTPPLSFFTGRMPFLPPNQQHQSTEGTVTANMQTICTSIHTTSTTPHNRVLLLIKSAQPPKAKLHFLYILYKMLHLCVTQWKRLKCSIIKQMNSRDYHTNPTSHSLRRQILAELGTDSTTVAMWSCDLSPDYTQITRLFMARTRRLPAQPTSKLEFSVKHTRYPVQLYACKHTLAK